ncbi:hypothetical protein IDJ77_24625 [Mucilaginibacter sp. ZT4R22]|uniref:Beta-carotene 15,15'-monooxygenase n=1 Tax=Mucilaginibacter pankratovii TaxID=2772110 RepID=A0ABR7WXK0_9SPHI|nr:hypothetical protein [Mucilaginibacter pankratovii]MBD1367019.1 hypothetical protein [Mucilaginibacter pankratovii]
MTVSQLNRLNYLNVVAMLLASCLAIVIPFELVLLSYAILGPAHYLTEISWLSGKQFFTLKKYDYVPILVVVVICLIFRMPTVKLIYYTFGLSVILQLINNYRLRGLAFILLIAAGNLLLGNNFWRTIFGVYIPTLIHVYVFTGAFLLYGALKSRITSGYVAVFFFLLCPALLCILFTSVNASPTLWAISNYGHFGRLNKISLRDQSLNIFTDRGSIVLTRVIAFAYTYHYINWFTKTEMIGWHRISITRAVIIGAIWTASVAVYFYHYRLGLSWLFILSLGHVILEFPLNQRSFVGIGKELRRRVAG